jgi:hypothetical protein
VSEERFVSAEAVAGECWSVQAGGGGWQPIGYISGHAGWVQSKSIYLAVESTGILSSSFAFGSMLNLRALT